jgi:hypothetical protein
MISRTIALHSTLAVHSGCTSGFFGPARVSAVVDTGVSKCDWRLLMAVGVPRGMLTDND